MLLLPTFLTHINIKLFLAERSIKIRENRIDENSKHCTYTTKGQFYRMKNYTSDPFHCNFNQLFWTRLGRLSGGFSTDAKAPGLGLNNQLSTKGADEKAYNQGLLLGKITVGLVIALVIGLSIRRKKKKANAQP
jgi:hypothetical protein